MKGIEMFLSNFKERGASEECLKKVELILEKYYKKASSNNNVETLVIECEITEALDIEIQQSTIGQAIRVCFAKDPKFEILANLYNMY